MSKMGGAPQKNVVAPSHPRLSSGPKAKQIHSIYRDRLRQFTDSGQFYRNGLMSYVLPGVGLFFTHPA